MRTAVSGKRTVLTLIVVLTVTVVVSVGVALRTLYQTAIHEQTDLLTDLAESRARMITGVAMSESQRAGGSTNAESLLVPILRLLDGAQFTSSDSVDPGRSMECLLVRSKDNQIVFVISQKGRTITRPSPVPFDTDIAAPARQALLGRSGTMMGRDYRGNQVLAVYRYLPDLKLGLVAKVDMAEIRTPFIKAVLQTSMVAILLVSVSALILLRIGNAMVAGVKRSEQRLRLALRTGHIGAFEVDLKNGQGIWTPEIASLWQVPQDFNGDFSAFCWSRVHPDDVSGLKARFAQLIQTRDEGEMEFRIIRNDSELRWIRWRGQVIQRPGSNTNIAIGVNMDITGQKVAEEQITMLKHSIEVHREGVYWIDTKGIIVYANLAGHEVLGYGPGDLFGEPIEMINPRMTAETLASVWNTLRTKGSFLNESVHQRKDGSEFPVEIMTTHLQFGGREFAAGFARNITDRLNAAAKLQESELRFRSIFEQAGLGAAVIDSEDGHYLRINAKYCEIIGYTEEEILGHSFLELTHPDDLEADLTNLARLRQGQIKTFSLEKRYIHKDGREVWVNLTVSPLWTEGKPVARKMHLALVQDITETKRLKESEARTQRLETAERIAGQIAHDFNNLLGPMMAYPELMRDQLPDGHPVRAYVDDIEAAASKIAEINQQLLTVSRRGHFSQTVLNVNTVISQAVRDLGPLPETLTLQTDLGSDLMNVRGGLAQIHRIILNLLVNARDAVGDRGTISVETRNYYADDTTILFNRVPRGEYVRITVSDTGKGISPEALPRIFEPFFTTKSGHKQRGSGLGLSIVDAVVKDHRGYIDVTTRAGTGTSFIVYLPVTRDQVVDEVVETIPSGTEKVMVIDDDDVQREIMSRLLTSLGYHVTLCESGEMAIEVLESTPHDLLVLDMIMPRGIDGLETYRRALRINGSQRAVIVSGYSESAKVRMAQDMGAGVFVRKPLSKKSIATAVRSELDRKQEPQPVGVPS
ncbi:MAG: PAS domain S-box protein [candidate division Zixibacteria bacterium]|nr:PAS domain S-box protein [candidate division Zixibacteria bacterium]